jgi:acetyltransferase
MITSDGTELILGAITDPQFGPALLDGGGGTLVDVLQGVRGRRPVDLAALEDALEHFSQFVH